METYEGVIVSIVKSRGFSFIRPSGDSKKDIFFSAAACVHPSDFEELREGLPVEFFLIDDLYGRGKRAIGIVVNT